MREDGLSLRDAAAVPPRCRRPLLPRVAVDVPLRDPDDVPVVAAAVAGAAEVIVTRDADLLDDTAVRRWLSRAGIEPVTSVEMLEWLDR